MIGAIKKIEKKNEDDFLECNQERQLCGVIL